jgi:hypothetical protein
VRARQLAEEPARFLLGEDGGQALGAFGAQGIDRSQILVQHLAVEEEKSAEGPVLGRSSDVLVDGQVGEEGLHFGSPHLGRVAFVVEQDAARDPADIGLFSAVGIVLQAQGIAHLV